MTGSAVTTSPVIVSVCGARAPEYPLAFEPTGSSVIVSENSPVALVLSVTSGEELSLPATTPLNAAKPLLVKALEPEIAKLPDSWSAGPVALFATARSMTGSVAPAAIVPKSSV